MKQISLLITGLFALLLIQGRANAQGCVAIRSTGSNLCTLLDPGDSLAGRGWQVNMGYRYFKSFRHFVGTEEQKERLKENTEVINHQHTLDLSLVRYFDRRWSLLIGAPLLANSRSQRARFGDRDRYMTQSYGLGDMRIAVYRWMLDPIKHHRGNFQIGMGLKLPTGDYKYQDYFPVDDSTKELRTVDQSIQLGDGGTGFIFEMNGFYNLSPSLGVYGNIYYLLNPREQNGTPTFRSRSTEAIMSVPDQYMLRAGATLSFGGHQQFAASLGGRMECVPVHDLVGGSEDFRRPGYVISIEPGITYMVGRTTIFAGVPTALVRNRTRSVPDMESSEQTGTYRHGDAAFADYVINLGASFRF